MEPMNPQLAALFELHADLPRQGPGDAPFTRKMLARLPALPSRPRVADLGCGSGAATLVLAEALQTPVVAVDLSRDFLDQLQRTANERGLAHLVRIEQADMGALDWPAGSLDLLWSEGAAYQLTFAGALDCWRPLLAGGGLAAISELTWFTDERPAAASAFWNEAYATAGSEAENARRAEAAGYEVLGIERLPPVAWWDNYYGPLERRIAELRGRANEAMRQVIAETEAEIALFREHGDAYGYAFYLLRAEGRS